MSVLELIKEVDKLESIDRQRLMSHLVVLRLRENEEYRERITRRLDDKNPENWINIDDLESRLKDNN